MTFALAMIGWVFFRAVTFHDSVAVFGQMLSGSKGELLIPGWLGVLALITLVLAIFEEKKGWFERIAVGPAWAYGESDIAAAPSGTAAQSSFRFATRWLRRRH
jgi:hypothetical protein